MLTAQEKGHNLAVMKWKKFSEIAFTGILVGTLAVFVILFFADIDTTNWVGGFFWWLVGLVILIAIGFTILIVWAIVSSFIHSIWDRLTKTKEQREKEGEQKKAEQDALDNLRRRGFM